MSAGNSRHGLRSVSSRVFRAAPLLVALALPACLIIFWTTHLVRDLIQSVRGAWVWPHADAMLDLLMELEAAGSALFESIQMLTLSAVCILIASNTVLAGVVIDALRQPGRLKRHLSHAAGHLPALCVQRLFFGVLQALLAYAIVQLTKLVLDGVLLAIGLLVLSVIALAWTCVAHDNARVLVMGDHPGPYGPRTALRGLQRTTVDWRTTSSAVAFQLTGWTATVTASVLGASAWGLATSMPWAWLGMLVAWLAGSYRMACAVELKAREQASARGNA